MTPAPLHDTRTANGRTLEYWTCCEDCPERKTCRHTCDHPGWMRFVVNGRRLVWWSGIITLRKIEQTARDYLESDPPSDVALSPAQLTQGRLEL